MKQAPDNLIQLAKSTVEPMGYELVGVQMINRGKHGKTLRVYIDKENGILLDDCASVSHQLSGVLDVEDPIAGNYELEVSSPGIDRPIFFAEHFDRFVGSDVSIQMVRLHEGRRKLTGRLLGMEGNDVVVEAEEKSYRLPIDDIDSARLVPKFDN